MAQTVAPPRFLAISSSRKIFLKSHSTEFIEIPLMKEYELKIADDFYVDLQAIIDSKEEYGMYKSNIAKFKENVGDRLVQLTTNPKSGADLSARVNKETAIKYFVIHGCLMFFEIMPQNEVDVLRLLPARTDWISRLF